MSKLGIKIVCKRIPTWRRAWHSYSYGQMVGWMKMPLGRGRPQPRPHCVRWGPSPHSSPSPLSAHAYCGQTVAHLSSCWTLLWLS